MLRSFHAAARVSAGLSIVLIAGASTLVAQSQPTSAPAPAFARVIAKEAQPRCWATASSPRYLDTFKEGDVLQVGALVGEFRAIVIPLGPTGFVSKKYATTPADGLVKTNGSDVAFRYRVPKSVEAPVHQLAKDAPLHFLGDEGEWWKVRSAGSPAWLPESELQLVAGEPSVAEAGLRQTEARRRQEWTDAVASFAQQSADKKAAQERGEKVQALVQRFRDEVQKPQATQSYEMLSADVDALIPSLPASSDESARCALLQSEIKKQKTVLEVFALQNEAPKKATLDPIGAPDVPDQLARFNAIGWLRKRSDLPAFRLSTGGGVSGISMQPGSTWYEIEKGGKVLYLVSCTSGRYDLSNFEGVEIGVVGTADRPNRESIRVLDVQKIEVISTRSR